VCEVTPYETMGTIFDKTNEIACNMLLKVLFFYEKHNTLPRNKQPDGDYPKARNYKEAETFVDYNKTAKEIERFVDSQNSEFKGIKLHKKEYDKIYSDFKQIYITTGREHNVDLFETID
jgi:methionyl-tRNA formyltransferase